jgi:deoxyribodipyrimidine photolyase-related protein
MILSNLATLLGIDPRSLTDWFWVAYIDAYDWVVEPNVLGMGTYATGDLMITKPYVSGAAYIDRMSDYCGDCAFDPKQNCPVTRLYWDFLARHADRFARNPRMSTAVAAGRKRAPEQQEEDARIANRMRAALALGETVSPETLGVSALRTKR